MKNLIFLLALTFTVSSSCVKKTDTSSTNSGAMEYTVDTLPDITVWKNRYFESSVSIPISLNYLSGEKEPVGIYIFGLPVGKATVQPSALAGTPPYKSTFIVDYLISDTGIYPIQVVTSGARSGKKNFGFNLIVADGPCAKIRYGNYSAKNTDSSDTSSAVVRIVSVGADSTQVIVGSQFGDMKGTVNCDGSIVFPYTTLGSTHIIGSALFTSHTINVTWHYNFNYLPGQQYFPDEILTYIYTRM